MAINNEVRAWIGEGLGKGIPRKQSSSGAPALVLVAGVRPVAQTGPQRITAAFLLLAGVLGISCGAAAQTRPKAEFASRIAPTPGLPARSPQYAQVQRRLASGWNTWDVHSVTRQVLLPDGLSIGVGLEHNGSVGGANFLSEVQIEDREPQVFAGSHAWDGSYTDLKLTWQGISLRIQSAHDGGDLVILVTPLPSMPTSALPPTLVFSAAYLWNRLGTVQRLRDRIEARDPRQSVGIFCTTDAGAAACERPDANVPVDRPYFAIDFTAPVGLSTGNPRTLSQIDAVIDRQRQAYEHAVAKAGDAAPMLDAIETTMGWDTIYDPVNQRVISPVTRSWSAGWGGYVLFDWDTFFGASLAATGDRDLAYANALEMLNEETPEGIVPNYASVGGWKSFDRSEPPVGSITVLDLYRRFHDRWFLEDAYAPLLRWNRWWAQHRDLDGYLALGSDAGNQPRNPDDPSVGTWQGAVYESGLDNSPMYDGTTFNAKSGKLEFADVGLMSLYIADCDALAKIAATLGKPGDEKELEARAARYRAKLQTLWSDKQGIFLNKNLHTGEFSLRLSPTNFYALLAGTATPAEAQRMVQDHLLNPKEFWGPWVIPAIARDDPAFPDQNYWRGRIWGPMNYLVWLGLRNCDDPAVRREFALKSWQLFQREWLAHRYVFENYNAITGMSGDVTSSDRFYHWGALLALIEYDQLTTPPASQ